MNAKIVTFAGALVVSLIPLLARAAEPTCKATPPGESSTISSDVLQTDIWRDGTLVFEPGGPGFVASDGGLGIKWGWMLRRQGSLLIGGRRLDGEAAPLRAYVNTSVDGYGSPGFLQPTYLVFPTPGCWEVTGAIAESESTLTFVVRVQKSGDGPTWQMTEEQLLAFARLTNDWKVR